MPVCPGTARCVNLYCVRCDSSESRFEMSTSPSLSPSPRPARSKTARPDPASSTPPAPPTPVEPPAPVSSPPAPARAPWTLRALIERSLGIDVRTLALFRIALALLLLNDLWVRVPDANAFYTDYGTLPRSAFLEIYGSLPNLVSLHLLSGLVGYELFLFALAAAFAVCLLVGYRTRWFTFLSWIMLVSLHNRNPVILHGGDFLMRMLLFWGLFLPLGRVWSLDALLAPDGPDAPDSLTSEGKTDPLASPRLLSVGTFAALMQMCFVYWFAVALKSDPVWREQGTALFYALSIDQLVKPLGLAMLAYPKLLVFLTHLTMGIERFGPILVLLPWWRSRCVMVMVFIGFHIMLGLCLTLGLFPFAAALGWLLFLPSECWEILGRRYAALAPQSALKSRVEAVRLRLEPWKAALVASRPATPPVAPLLVLVPRLKLVLHWVGTQGMQGVAALMLAYVLAFNLRTIDANKDPRYLPSTADWLAEATRSDQTWGMFAPKPLDQDGWYVVPAKLADGQTVDLFRDGAPLNWNKPILLSETYKNERWQKYTLNLYSNSDAAHRPYYAAYLKRRWNDTHPQAEHVVDLQIVYMREDSVPGQTDVIPKKIVLWPLPPAPTPVNASAAPKPKASPSPSPTPRIVPNVTPGAAPDTFEFNPQ